MIHLFRGVQIAELDVQVVNVSPPIEVAEDVTHTRTHTHTRVKTNARLVHMH